jgi:uncharacterized protein (TIGR02466 family)
MIRKLNELFATPVAVSIFDDTDFCKRYSKIILDGMTAEELALGIGATADNLNSLTQYDELVKIIDAEATRMFDEVLGLDRKDLTMTCMWSNVQRDRAKHHIHSHPNSFYSGVIYLDIPKDCDPGNIFFIDPRQAKNMWHADYKKPNGLSYRDWFITPVTGMMLLFPSWLEHGTDICKVGPGKHRISLSFNYMLSKASGPTMKI